MFSNKALFSEILCPHLESCVLPRCIFLHVDTLSAPIRVISPSKGVHHHGQFEGEDGARRKRRKTDLNTVTGAQAAISLDCTSQSPSARRPVSPPPSKRAIQTEEKVAIKPHSSVALAPALKPKTVMPSAPVKVEDLNPRMLKSAPASHDLRFKLLKALHDNLFRLNSELRSDASMNEEKLVLSDQEVIKMALDLEESAAVGKPTIYSNVVKNAILLYKRMSVKDWKAARFAEIITNKKAVHAKAGKPVKPDPDEPIETGLTSTQERAFLCRLLTPLDGLSEHGYVTTVPTTAEVFRAQQGVEAAGGWEECDRCRSRFRVHPGRREEDGALTSGGGCCHHWGKAYFEDKDPLDPKAKRVKKYRCCNEPVGESTGCFTSTCHVFKISENKRLAAVLQFAKTPESTHHPSSAEKKVKGPICIDGEMGYTVHGLELIRLTATSWPDGKELLDVLVRPVGEVLDLNSRWSGVWPEQFATAVPWESKKDHISLAEYTKSKQNLPIPMVASPAHARELLYKYLTPTTVVIGHGLENDLNALRLVHPTIIDTVFLYPHRAGLPFRHGLKALMLQHLGRNIQMANDASRLDVEEGKGGHDSKEDARAAGELVRWKIKTEWAKMKAEGWIIDQLGGLTSPEQPGNGQLGLKRSSALMNGDK